MEVGENNKTDRRQLAAHHHLLAGVQSVQGARWIFGHIKLAGLDSTAVNQI